MALSSPCVLRGESVCAPKYRLPFLLPPPPHFCSLVSTRSPADCTEGKIINANTTQHGPQPTPELWGSHSPPVRKLPLAGMGRVPTGGTSAEELGAVWGRRPSLVRAGGPGGVLRPSGVTAHHPKTGLVPGRAGEYTLSLVPAAATRTSPEPPQPPVALPLDQSPPPLVTNSSPAFFFPFPPFLLKSPSALGELGCFCIPQGRFPSGAPCRHLPGSPGEGRGWPLDASTPSPPPDWE